MTYGEATAMTAGGRIRGTEAEVVRALNAGDTYRFRGELRRVSAESTGVTAEQQASARRQAQMRAMRFGCLRQIGLAQSERLEALTDPRTAITPGPDATFPVAWGERDAVV